MRGGASSGPEAKGMSGEIRAIELHGRTPTFSDAVTNYLDHREEKVSDAILERDQTLLSVACHALDEGGREHFNDYRLPRELRFSEFLPVVDAVDALPLLLGFGQERFGEYRRDLKVYLSCLKGFYGWLIPVFALDKSLKKLVGESFKQAEVACQPDTRPVVPKYKWDFASKFRKGAYPWNGTAKAQAALKQALSELKSAARDNAGLAAEGATVLLQKLVPSIEKIDSSSGALGSSVYDTVVELAEMVGRGHAWAEHEARVERCFDALQDDGYGYLDILGDRFAAVCGTSAECSKWADRLLSITREVLGGSGGFFQGTSATLACLCASGRYAELEELLGLRSRPFWLYDRWWAKALLAQDRVQEALDYASMYPEAASFREKLLLEQGRVEEAYKTYGLRLNESTYLNCFRDVCKRYPQIEKGRVLRDLIASTPGDEGKWFAAARSAGELELAQELAWHGPCAPSTLMTAVKDLRAKRPDIAYNLACAALRGIDLGWSYELDMALAHRAKAEAEALAVQLERQGEWQSFRRSLKGILKRRAGF